MKKTLKQIVQKWGADIDIDLLKKALGLDKQSEIQITTDGLSISIIPKRRIIEKVSDDAELQKIVEKNLEKYDEVLRKLAKS